MPGIHRLVLLLISDKQNRAWGLCGTLALMLFAPIAPLTARAQPVIVIPSKADEREVIGGIFKRWIIHPGVSAAMAAAENVDVINVSDQIENFFSLRYRLRMLFLKREL